MVDFLLFVLVVAIGYLFGSFSSAIIVSRVFSLPDPRVGGSKNPGATNVLRLAGKKYAVLVLIADVLKGVIPVAIARLFEVNPLTLGFVCFAAVMGHIYPVFFGFKGGKGVATAIGALFCLNLILGGMVIATWLVVANYSRYSSLASMTAITLAPVYSAFTIGQVDIIVPLFFIAVFILFQHRNNITRLIDGEEPKILFRQGSENSIADQLTQPETKILTSDEVQEENPGEKPQPQRHKKTVRKKTTGKKTAEPKKPQTAKDVNPKE
ncbi:glycerol-3-phosphate 1-O-acyltransferase PlsY [Legionella spiritensis]|uniref:glycerol-3-phosphate 1-O-acyltransferase PlsY n=1 Tax=Legionella spiritensis TaxID=452 RepID=UPI000F6E28A8|nr:glycerol-3-phosphate 1-O-acyltransferase PlsY [Legionella spiritensis]VEG92172.1 transmembrane protein [Legionella spiritensis]